ncbi:MAG: hypothetical protein JSS63_10630 [Bacteroidetes bacterium]|nr:hypothetical protein [Bacteroidota bacterium]
MIKGFFRDNIAFINLNLSWGTTTLEETFLIDTGFAGGLMITPLLAAQLALDITETKTARLADNSIVNMMAASVVVNLNEEFNLVEVLISSGLPIVGMDFFMMFGYKIIIDCKLRTITLEK